MLENILTIQKEICPNIEKYNTAITFGFCVLILILFLFNILKQRGNKSEYTSWGMLGTFLGIFIGLSCFDTTNADTIEKTLPNLLRGLRFAFITSIIGLFLSILHEWLSQNWDTNTDNDPTNKLLKKIADNIRVLGADGEGTLLGQFKLLRSDFNDFAGKVAKSSSEQATKAIVEALTEVIKNFNAKITEQFGDNFKHLNEGVEKLLVWQKDYQEYMEGYKENLDFLSKAIETNSQAVAKLPDMVDKVHQTVETTDNELLKLTTTTEALKEFSEGLNESLPQLVESIQSLTDDSIEKMTQLTKETTESLQKIAEEMTQTNVESVRALTDNSIEKITQLTQETVESIQKTAQETRQTTENVSEKVIEEIEDLSKSASDSLRELDSQAKQTIPSVKKSLEDVVSNTDEQLEVVGQHIVSIVQKLVRDFDDLSSTLQNFKRPNNRG